MLRELVVIDGIATTSVRRTLLDLAGVGDRRTENAVDDAVRRELTTIGDLWVLLADDMMRGRRGIDRLRSLLRERTPGHLSESVLESMMERAMRDGELPPARKQYPIALPSGRIRLDFAYPDALIDIECDGYSWHGNREAFERDRKRDIELQRIGWLVLRFTWPQVRFEPERVISHVRHHLRSRSGVSTAW